MAESSLIRAIVALSLAHALPLRRAFSPEQRRQAIAERKQAASQALEDVDHLLERCGGRRLSPVGAIGTVTVEGTPGCIRDLATLDQVEAILEDQPIHTTAA